MFSGGLSLWHILIVVLVVFILFGPRKIARTGKDLGDRLSHIGEEREDPTSEPLVGPPDPAPARKRGLAYRLGRMLARRRVKP